jgi:hypothetical protein
VPDKVICDPRVACVGGVLEGLEPAVLLGVLEDRPLRLAEQDARDETVLALADLMTGFPGGFRASHPREPDRRELARDVVELLDPAPDPLEIRLGKKPAWPLRIPDATLIPLQSNGLNNSVEQPALFGKAARPPRRLRAESGHAVPPADGLHNAPVSSALDPRGSSTSIWATD